MIIKLISNQKKCEKCYGTATTSKVCLCGVCPFFHLAPSFLPRASASTSHFSLDYIIILFLRKYKAECNRLFMFKLCLKAREMKRQKEIKTRSDWEKRTRKKSVNCITATDITIRNAIHKFIFVCAPSSAPWRPESGANLFFMAAPGFFRV